MQQLKVASLLWLCAIPLLIIGCARMEEHDVPGTYTAIANWGTSTLVLRNDHTFQQTVRLKSGEVKHMTGKWGLVSPAKNSVNYNITLGPLLDVKHDKQGVYAPWSFSSIDQPPFRGTEIAADPDWGIEYRKQS